MACARSFQNEKLSRNESQMDGPGALRLAKALRNATQTAGPLFGQDVRTAAQLLARVLRHESGRQGFELAATQDADFHQVGGTRALLGGGAVTSPGRLPCGSRGALGTPRQAFSRAPLLPWRSKHAC